MHRGNEPQTALRYASSLWQRSSRNVEATQQEQPAVRGIIAWHVPVQYGSSRGTPRTHRNGRQKDCAEQHRDTAVFGKTTNEPTKEKKRKREIQDRDPTRQNQPNKTERRLFLSSYGPAAWCQACLRSQTTSSQLL